VPIQAVFFDIGETIIDETSVYGGWADWLGVPRHTFSTVFGATIARGADHLETFKVFRPDFDVRREQGLRRRAARAELPAFTEEQLYPDVRDCLTGLRGLGVRVGLAGNQPAEAEGFLRALELPADVVATSEGWGATKPSPAFFHRLVREAGVPAAAVLYVGDRLDNDVVPAHRMGLRTALLRRGPWAYIQRTRPSTGRRCLFRLDSLGPLPELVAAHNLV
jgi:HAD superfamily hydrolase (TIGR01549 family)